MRKSLRLFPRTAALVIIATLGGCSVIPVPVTPEEREQRVENDRKLLSSDVAADRPITLYQAQAYALKFNLDRRLKLMEEAATAQINDVAGFAMLPQMAASAGYLTRSDSPQSLSYTPSTDVLSDPSVTGDRSHFIASLTTTWNVLDFGVSFLRARQQSNLVLVAAERRRKVIQIIMNDVRAAYWRALNAQIMSVQLDPLTNRVQNALNSVQNDQSIVWSTPAQKLDYQRTLLELMQQLQALHREVESARLDFSTLLNVDYGQKLVLARPSGFDAQIPLQAINVEEMERMALLNRPELREEDYMARINADETRKAIVRMLPGIEFSSALNRDTNSYILPHNWAEAGLKLTWNLMNLIAGPDNITAAETQESIEDLRRLSVSMAVITQVNVATRRFALARSDYDLAERMAAVDQQLLAQCGCGSAGTPQDELTYLRRATLRLYTRFRGDAAFVEVQNAAGAINVSVGKDPVPDDVSVDAIDTLSHTLETRTAEWTVVRPPVFGPSSQAARAPLPQAAVQMMTQSAPDPIEALATDPAVNRFLIFTRLVAQGAATSDEFAARRYPNLGALLTYAEPPPSVGIFIQPLDLETIAQKLRAAGSTKERTKILDSLLPAHVTTRTKPAGRSADALAAASNRIQSLLKVGLVTAAEAERETSAIASIGTAQSSR